MKEHQITQSTSNSQYVDCSCGLKGQTALGISMHLKSICENVSSNQTNSVTQEPKDFDFIKHIELATGRRHLTIGGQDFYISEEEVEALRSAVQ